MASAPSAGSPRLRLLGPPALVVDSVAAPLKVPQKAIALLALLAAEYDVPLSRARLAELLWPEIADEEARTNLRRQLYLLVRRIGAQAFILTKNTAQWNDAFTPSDLAAFLRYAAEPQSYDRAVALWHGALASGIHDDALSEVRERLSRRYASLLWELSRCARTAANHSQALHYLEQLLAFDSLDDSVVRALMQCRLHTGDRAGALAEYNALAQRLRLELDVEPEAETTALFQSIVYGSESALPPHNITSTFTSFIGREMELDEIAQAFESHRAVTLVGPARLWTSHLPFAPIRHAKHSGGRTIDSPRDQILLELQRHGFPIPTGLQLLQGGVDKGFRRLSGSHLKPGPRHLAAIEFAHPVAGPISLGAAAHFGMGLFLPCFAPASV